MLAGQLFVNGGSIFVLAHCLLGIGFENAVPNVGRIGRSGFADPNDGFFWLFLHHENPRQFIGCGFIIGEFGKELFVQFFGFVQATQHFFFAGLNQ